MPPTQHLQPTPRRLASTAWFVAFMSFVLLREPLREGRGVDRAALGVLIPAAIAGYLLWPVWGGAANGDGGRSFRERAWKTALSLGAGLAAALTFDALLTDGVGGASLLRAASLFGGIYFFVMVMPRIATGRWQ